MALALGLLLALSPVEHARADDWRDALRARLEKLDKETPGQLGVYVKRLDNGESLSYAADRPWYLSSSAKVPIAIAVLQQVDAGKLRTDQRLAVQDTDRIDGPGELVWARTGTAYTVDSLITRMLGVSDNTAANLLVRTIGEDTLNASASKHLGKGFEKLTTLTQVRRDVYGELHPRAAQLPNQRLVEVASEPLGPRRVEAVRRAIGVPAGELKTRSIDEAYASYYRKGFNSATLEGYGSMLEQLVRGQLLSPDSTRRLFTAMKFGRRGDYRMEGGIPKSQPIIHKTGTQHRRACHMVVVNPQDGGARGIVITACTADLDEQRQAGPVLRGVGSAVSAVLLQPVPSR